MENYIQLDRVSDMERVEFYKKTYTHVALGVLVFILVEALFLNIPMITNFALSLTQGRMWFLMLGGFMLVTYQAEKMAINSHERSKQYLGFGLYIIAEAFIFIPLLYIAMSMTDGYDLIKQAALLTVALFAGLSATVIMTNKDFSFLKSALTIGGFIALGLIGAGLLFGFNLGLWFSVGMVVLAAGSILYQTSNLVHKYNTDQYVAAALGLFASLMLMFWYILRIFMSRK
jgi:FtsH-binding integral membrane protein